MLGHFDSALLFLQLYKSVLLKDNIVSLSLGGVFLKAKKVTIKDVALKANVSKATVSYVLNDVDKVSNDTKQRVLDAIEELGYIPNSTARDLAKQTTTSNAGHNPFMKESPFYQEFMDAFIQNKVGKISKETKSKLLQTIGEWGYLPANFLDQLMTRSKTTIALFLEMEHGYKDTVLDKNPFYQEFISGVEHTVQENRLNVRIFNSRIQHSYEELMEQSFLGVIVVGKPPVHLSVILKQMNIPIIIVDEYEFHPKFVTITSEDKKGAFDSIEYLILKGHKSIAYVGNGNDQSNIFERRIEGYKEALESYGIPFNKEHIYLSEIDYSYDEGIRIAQKIADNAQNYDAIFCTCDIMAIGLMKGLMRKGYKVPEDISIMGFDNIQFSKYCNPELTTVDQNIFLKAETAVTIIKRKAKGEHVKSEYMLPVSIVERESVYNRSNQRK